jgi:hypothetical protein
VQDTRQEVTSGSIVGPIAKEQGNPQKSASSTNSQPVVLQAALFAAWLNSTQQGISKIDTHIPGMKTKRAIVIGEWNFKDISQCPMIDAASIIPAQHKMHLDSRSWTSRTAVHRGHAAPSVRTPVESPV